MASVGFGTVAPAVAPPAGGRILLGRRAARTVIVPAATKVVAAKQQQQEEKGLFDSIFGALYKEEQLLETDPILNKVETKAKKVTAGKAAAAAAAGGSGGGGGFSFGGLFSSKE